MTTAEIRAKLDEWVERYGLVRVGYSLGVNPSTVHRYLQGHGSSVVERAVRTFPVLPEESEDDRLRTKTRLLVKRHGINAVTRALASNYATVRKVLDGQAPSARFTVKLRALDSDAVLRVIAPGARSRPLTDEEVEEVKAMIGTMVEEHGSRQRVARVLGMSERTVYRVSQGHRPGKWLHDKLHAYFVLKTDLHPPGRLLKMNRASERQKAAYAVLFHEKGYWRPTNRTQCVALTVQTPRPCPYILCRYNLFGEVLTHGNYRLRLAGTDPTDPGLPSCSLDVADRGRHTPKQLGVILNLTPKRVIDIIDTALAKLGLSSLREFDDE
jgi:DNA-binding CsgD family transcriptional regulator